MEAAEITLKREEAGTMTSQMGTPPMGTPPMEATATLRRRRKRPLFAGLLSLMPGLGHIYVGYYRRGFILLLTVAAMMTLMSGGVKGAEPLFGMSISFLWLFGVIDAVRLANLYNEALAGLGPEDLRQELTLVGRRGSIGAGALIILASFFILLHTRFGMPLDWMKDWWPILPLGFGAYLLLQGIRDRRK